MHNIKWCGLYDQNSNKLHAAVHAQLLLQFTHELKYNERNEGLMPGLRKLQDSARYVKKKVIKKQMTRFVQCVKMPIFILYQGVFKWLASIYQPWQSSVGLSGVGQGLYDKNSVKLYAPAQLLPYEQKHKRKDKKHMRNQ